MFLVLTGVVLPLLTRWLSRRPAAESIHRRGELNAAVVDGLFGIAELTALDQAASHRARLLELGDEVDRASDRLATIRGLGAGLAVLLTGLCAVAILIVAIPLVRSGRLDGVYLALLPLAAIAAFEAVQPLGLSLQLAETSRAAAGRLFELIDAPAAVADPVEPAALPASHDIEVRGLRFGYGGEGAPLVLDGLDLTIPDGGSLAIVGPSGAGKSTVVNLLLRFWDYGEGEIRIGGRTCASTRPRTPDRCSGSSPSGSTCSTRRSATTSSIADAAVTDETMIAACRQAQIHDVIASLPDGYDTRIGEDGVRLSGGERRRLAIARAIIRDAPILILDEATADLDAATEERLLASLEPFLASRTTILISHRAAVARAADTVVAMERGRGVAIDVRRDLTPSG